MTSRLSRRAILAGAGAALCAPMIGRAGPTNRFGPYVGLRNRLNDRFLLVENGALRMGTEQEFRQTKIGWSPEYALDPQYRRIKVVDGSGSYIRLLGAVMTDRSWNEQDLGALHIENGRLEVGPYGEGWWSAQWSAEKVYQPGTSIEYFRFRNRWKPDQYLHIANGPPDAGPIKQGSWPSVWSYVP